MPENQKAGADAPAPQTEIERLMAEWWALESLHEGPGWRGGIGCEAPVQGAGIVDGIPWYFRARYSSWNFYVAETPDGDPVCGVWIDGDDYGEEFGFAASWMSKAEARAFIERGIATYRRLVSEQPAAQPPPEP